MAWCHQIENADPYVSLMVNQGYKTQDLGPIVKEALLIQQWDSTENPLISLSHDHRLIRIEFPGGDQGMAERVLLDKMEVSQMSNTLSTESKDLLLKGVSLVST